MDSWYKLRDTKGVEWELEDNGMNLSRREICSSEKKTDVWQETFKIKETGDIVDYFKYTTCQIRSIKVKPRPAF